jgi:hypothetical protein
VIWLAAFGIMLMLGAEWCLHRFLLAHTHVWKVRAIGLQGAFLFVLGVIVGHAIGVLL